VFGFTKLIIYYQLTIIFLDPNEALIHMVLPNWNWNMFLPNWKWFRNA
jgi:hypothetical protein